MVTAGIHPPTCDGNVEHWRFTMKNDKERKTPEAMEKKTPEAVEKLMDE